MKVPESKLDSIVGTIPQVITLSHTYLMVDVIWQTFHFLSNVFGNIPFGGILLNPTVNGHINVI